MTGLARAVVVVVPGGDCAGEPDPALVEWPRLVHPTTTWTLSVDTGSGYLASTGATAVTDLALTLLDLSHGPDAVQAVQLALEHDPQPPTTPAPRRRRPPRSASS